MVRNCLCASKDRRPNVLTSDANNQLASLDRELIEQRVRALWELRSRGEVTSLASLLAHDCVYSGKTWFEKPVDIRRDGRDACLEWAHQLNAMVQHVETEILYLIIEGEQVAACRRMRFRERGCGRIEEVIICSYTRFRGGEIVEIVEYPDTLAVKRLLAN